jgi:calcium binding protein 39
MAFLFGRSRQKSPADLVRAVHDATARLDIPIEKKRAQEDIAKHLALIKSILMGDGTSTGGDVGSAQSEQVAQLSQEIYTKNTLLLLAANIWRLDFDARKDYTAIFSTLLRRQIGSRYPTVDYLSTHEDILLTLVKG